jgi:hypothetical protein
MPDNLVLYHVSTFFDISFCFNFLEFISKRVKLPILHQIQFLARLKPIFTDDPTVGPYNHGFLSGTVNSLSYQTQGIIDEKLEIISATGKGHGA